MQYVLAQAQGGNPDIFLHSISTHTPAINPDAKLTEVQAEDLYFCLENRIVYVRETEIMLTVKEFDIFALLIMNPRRVLTYEMIIDLVWHENLDYYSHRAINIMSATSGTSSKSHPKRRTILGAFTASVTNSIRILNFSEVPDAYCGRDFFSGKKQDFSWSVPGLSSKKSEELSVIVFSDRGEGQAHRTDAVQNMENTDMTVFSNLCSDTSRQDNTTAFPSMIEWATATNKAIAPMEFPDALHYLMKDQKMTVEHLEETSLISTRTIIRLSNDPDYGVTREHIVALSVGLTLPPIISMELLRKAGLVMKNTMRHNTYCMVLCEMYSCKIEAVNQFLVSLNIPPLTRLGAKM